MPITYYKLSSHSEIVKQICTLIFAGIFLWYIEPTWGLHSINFCADSSEILKLEILKGDEDSDVLQKC